MKLTENTVNVLKNFSTINPNLLVKEGSTITTMSAMKNILAKANVDEQFNQQFAIYDLNEFLSSTSLFKTPVIDFENQFLTINEETSKGTKLKYFYSCTLFCVTFIIVICVMCERIGGCPSSIHES